MSLKLSIPFTSGSGYTYDADKIEFVGGEAKLKLIDDPGQLFTQTFDSDTGFTYDSAKAEFTGGKVQQKTQRPAGATFGATYTSSVNANWGNGILTGVLAGGASVAGGKLIIPNGNALAQYASSGNAVLVQEGAVKFKFIPNYNGFPAANSFLFNYGGSAAPYRNQISVFHTSTGGFNIMIRDNTGATKVSLVCGTFTAVLGQTYEIELNYNLTTGATRLFKDGVQFGATDTNTGTRDLTDCNLFIIGNSATYAYGVDGAFDDVVIFSAVQHTANYTAGYSLPELEYVNTNVICPEMAYSGIGTLISFDDFITTEAGTPRYALQIGRSGDYLYWTGAAWAVSDNTYAQANTKADFLANLATLPILGEIYGQFKILFPDINTQSSVSELTADLTAQIYPTDNPAVEVDASFGTQKLEGFTETATKTGSDEIKYILKKGTVWYYHNGSTWVTSNGTYAQSNTTAEILAAIATFTTVTATVKVKLFLHSTDGGTSPSIDLLEIDYDFSDVPDDISKCIVYGHQKVNGDACIDRITVRLSEDGVLYKTDTILRNYEIFITPDSTGYFEVELIETDNMSNTPNYVWNIGKQKYISQVSDQSTCAFHSLKNLRRI